MGKAIRYILRYGILQEREPGSIELTIEIFRQLRDLEYESMSSDKENLRNDWNKIGSDLQKGVKDCKKEYELEFA